MRAWAPHLVSYGVNVIGMLAYSISWGAFFVSIAIGGTDWKSWCAQGVARNSAALMQYSQADSGSLSPKNVTNSRRYAQQSNPARTIVSVGVCRDVNEKKKTFRTRDRSFFFFFFFVCGCVGMTQESQPVSLSLILEAVDLQIKSRGALALNRGEVFALRVGCAGAALVLHC